MERSSQDIGLCCKKCAKQKTEVKDSRPSSGKDVLPEARPGALIRRRRACPVCGTRFTTYEISEEDIEAMKAEFAHKGVPDALLHLAVRGGKIQYNGIEHADEIDEAA